MPSRKRSLKKTSIKKRETTATLQRKKRSLKNKQSTKSRQRQVRKLQIVYVVPKNMISTNPRRRSPAVHAANTAINVVSTGLDGHSWIVTSDRNGRHFWKRL
jgi:hypothetical protein